MVAVAALQVWLVDECVAEYSKSNKKLIVAKQHSTQVFSTLREFLHMQEVMQYSSCHFDTSIVKI